MQQNGKLIISIGLIVLVVGIIIYFFGDKLGWIGNLPGDFKHEGKNTKIYFPVMTMIILSLIINLVLYLFRKL